MTMEQRVLTLEEVSQLLIAASRGLNESVQRLEAFADAHESRRLELERQRQEYERQRQEYESRRLEYERQQEHEMRELAAAVQRSDQAVQALLAFVPVTQAEIVRLDSRIDNIEGA